MKYYTRIFLLLYVLMLVYMIFYWRTRVYTNTAICDIHHPPVHRFDVTWNGDEDVDVANPLVDDVFTRHRDQYKKYLLEGSKSFCRGRFLAYKNLFAKLKNVLVDTRYGEGKIGGENISDVVNQDEDREYYQLKCGFFQLTCEEQLLYGFGEDSHLNKWMDVLHRRMKPSKKKPALSTEFTVAVTRYEYANLYHTMTDFYNTFLVLKLFNVKPNNATVLWVDGHPRGALDATWSTLFGKVRRVGDIRRPVVFEDMIWGIVGYDSPLDEHLSPSVPYIEEFRNFFLSKHDIWTENKVDCDRLNIVLLWRHDYLAHPRNPSGTISRKIKNEKELLDAFSDKFDKHNVLGLQIDLYPMKKQLDIISQTDILIGMHGAGLSHTMFLPRHAGLIEMFPTYFSSENRHFRAMAEWRHLHYFNWINEDFERDIDNKLTIVDIDKVIEIAQNMEVEICAKHRR